MLKSIFFPACCLAILLLALPVAAQSGWQREAREFGWLTDYRAALDEAKETSRPLMVVFRCVP